ncbi:MAG: hypothetical protein IJ060_01260 [Oscillospiraceae bacterium]|nr:hypothetical protein [Oscillospiraceae bacterium]
MDQTIRRILELDAETEQRLEASRLKCGQMRAEAEHRAAAIRQAQAHQTRDTITEFEEQTRESCEQKLAVQRQAFDRQADAISKQFEEQHESLLESLFEETLREAES